MQLSMLQRAGQQSLARRDGRRVAFAPARTTGAGRSLSVQVFAKKGKGKGIIRQSAGVPGQSGMMGPGAQSAVMQDAKVPEVDMQQVEFVLFVRGLNVTQNKITVKETPWYPLSIVKAGQQGSVLVQLLENEWGRKLYSNLLIRNIGQSVYKDKEMIAANLRKNFPVFKETPTKSFVFAFKIRDKTRPDSWKTAENLTVLPPESDVAGNPLDTVRQFFSTDNLASMFKSN